MKKIFALLAALAMMLMCAGAMAEEADYYYEINSSTIDNSDADEYNTYWNWDASSKELTLTLNDYPYRITGLGDRENPINIILVGNLENLMLNKNVCVALNKGYLYWRGNISYLWIDGSKVVPLNVYVGKDADHLELFTDSPFTSSEDVRDAVYDFAGRLGIADDEQVIICTEIVGASAEPAPDGDVPPTDNLPKTGDSSRLALWLALLAFAGAGMMARRKMEA